MANNPFEEILVKLDIMLRDNKSLRDEVAQLKAEITIDAARICFTLQEAAKATGLSYHTLYNWAQDGTMETLQPGGIKGKRMVTRDELIRVLRECRTKANAER